MASPPQRPLLHIGLHKTGSSTIQAFLALNRDVLELEGIAYPQGPEGYGAQHSELANRLHARDDAAFTAQCDGLMDDTTGFDRWILSGESFSRLRPDAVETLARRLRGERPRVLVYVRNLYDWAFSNLTQRAKTGMKLVSPFALDQHVARLDLRRLLETWEEAFGERFVEVRALDQMPPGRDLIDDFSEAAGIAHIVLQRPAANRNQSIDYVSSLLLNGMLIETRLDHVAFYRAYASQFGAPPAFGAVRRMVHDALDAWVEAVDLDHPKLAPFADGLKQRPADRPRLSRAETVAYARSLSRTLSDWAEAVERAGDKPQRQRGVRAERWRQQDAARPARK